MNVCYPDAKNWMIVVIFCIVNTFSVCSAAEPAAISWPNGWSLHDNSRMTPQIAGDAAPGSNKLAIKTDVLGNVSALIEFDNGLLPASARPYFDEGTSRIMTRLYDADSAQKHTNCTALKEGLLDGLPSRETECEIRISTEVTSRMRIVVAYGTDRVYTLVYAGTPQGYVSNRSVFDSVEQSLNIR